MGNARWTGVPLARLLTAAGLDGAARFVVFRSADNYDETLPLVAALDPATLLVHAMNGQPLSPKHGFPLRIILPGRYGVKNPKWLTRIEVAAEPGGGYWPKRGWNTDAPVQTTARIDAPTGETPLAGPRVLVGGVAFAGDRGVSRVEVSADDGHTWRPAQSKPPLARTTWALWGFVWEDPPPGEHVLVARAVDGTGAVQTAEERPQLPDGAAGYHRVRVHVTEPTSEHSVLRR